MSSSIHAQFTSLAASLKSKGSLGRFMSELQELVELEIKAAIADQDCDRAMAVIGDLGGGLVHMIDFIKPTPAEFEIYVSASSQIFHLQNRVEQQIRPHWPNHDYFKRKDKALKKLKNLGNHK